MGGLLNMNRRLRLTHAQLQARADRREARRAHALRVLQDWHPTPVPPLACGPSIKDLVSLEADGLARRVGLDALGDLRFALPEPRP